MVVLLFKSGTSYFMYFGNLRTKIDCLNVTETSYVPTRSATPLLDVILELIIFNVT